MLLRPEPAPTAVEQMRQLRAEDALRTGIAVRDVHAGDLVVLIVLAEPGEARIDRR